jgi:hypothetical protein
VCLILSHEFEADAAVFYENAFPYLDKYTTDRSVDDSPSNVLRQFQKNDVPSPSPKLGSWTAVSIVLNVSLWLMNCWFPPSTNDWYPSV